MKSFKVDIRAQREIYSYFDAIEKCNGHIDAYPENNPSKHANGKSYIGIMSISSLYPTIIDVYDEEDIKTIEKVELFEIFKPSKDVITND